MKQIATGGGAVLAGGITLQHFQSIGAVLAGYYLPLLISFQCLSNKNVFGMIAGKREKLSE